MQNKFNQKKIVQTFVASSSSSSPFSFSSSSSCCFFFLATFFYCKKNISYNNSKLTNNTFFWGALCWPSSTTSMSLLLLFAFSSSCRFRMSVIFFESNLKSLSALLLNIDVKQTKKTQKNYNLHSFIRVMRHWDWYFRTVASNLSISKTKAGRIFPGFWNYTYEKRWITR